MHKASSLIQSITFFGALCLWLGAHELEAADQELRVYRSVRGVLQDRGKYVRVTELFAAPDRVPKLHLQYRYKPQDGTHRVILVNLGYDKFSVAVTEVHDRLHGYKMVGYAVGCAGQKKFTRYIGVKDAQAIPEQARAFKDSFDAIMSTQRYVVMAWVFDLEEKEAQFKRQFRRHMREWQGKTYFVIPIKSEASDVASRTTEEAYQGAKRFLRCYDWGKANIAWSIENDHGQPITAIPFHRQLTGDAYTNAPVLRFKKAPLCTCKNVTFTSLLALLISAPIGLPTYFAQKKKKAKAGESA